MRTSFNLFKAGGRVAFLAATASIALVGFAHAQRKPKRPAAPVVPARGVLSLSPASSTLDGSYSYQTVCAVLTAPDGSQVDVTSKAILKSSNPAVLRVAAGQVQPVSDGQAEVIASLNGQSARAKLTVRNTRTDASLSFANEITPILIKSGCSGAACHGAANGRGGFKLSFFGYEPDKDRDAIWTVDKGRRVNAKDPANSTLLLKPLGVVPHTGGKRFAMGSAEYRTLVAWLKAGGPLGAKGSSAAASGARLASAVTPTTAGPAVIESISVWPTERTTRTPGSQHQLIVTAHYSNGDARDVTPIARYFSDDEGIVSTTSTGSLTAKRYGEANIMVRFNGMASVSRFYSLIRPDSGRSKMPSDNNFIDTHVFAKLKKMGIAPSGISSDGAFIRRVSLDIAGVLPAPVAVRNFVASTDPDKRVKLINDLLERPEYQDVMTIQWSELLRINRTFLQEEGVRQYTAFVRESFADNKPFNRFAHEVISSASHPRDAVEKSRDAQSRVAQAVYKESSGYHSGPVNYYRVTADPTELTTSTSQIFLGVRLDCSRCHNHPFDRWSMNDFYGFAAYFAGTGYAPGKQKDEVAIFTDRNGAIANPRTGQTALPKPLTEKVGAADPDGRRHRLLADWITSKENPFFARSVVNRFWKHFFGRGIVHPVDDFRATNPPINEPLLDALAKDFVDHNFDVKHLIRTICGSRVYQLSDEMNSSNETDTKNFSRFYSKRLGPEVLFDAFISATGVPETFGGAVARRATNLPDNNVPSYFLDVFGRSRRLQVQENSEQTSMSQALQLMNGGAINDRLSDPRGRVSGILKSQMTPPQALEEVFLSTLSRLPTAKEKAAALRYIEESPTPKEGYEDLMWAILNSREFIFNH